MKPTSYIFLILALILLFTGWTTCSIAESMAKSRGTQIFEQKKDKSGDTVYKYQLSDEKLSKLTLTFSDVDVLIVGSSPSSYVELKNFDPYEYTTTLSGSTVTVDGNAGGLSSLIDMSGGGFKFKGLRYFFSSKPEKGRAKSVTIYLSDACDVSSLNLTLTGGSVTVKDLYNGVDINLKVSDGNINLETVSTTAVLNVTLGAGNFNVNNSKFATLSANVTGGTTNIMTNNIQPEFISYNITSTTSTLFHNGTAIEEGALKITSPKDIQKTLIKIDATDATIYINDSTAQASEN